MDQSQRLRNLGESRTLITAFPALFSCLGPSRCPKMLQDEALTLFRNFLKTPSGGRIL